MPAWALFCQLCILGILRTGSAATALNPNSFTALGSYASSGNITITTNATPNWPGIGNGVVDATTGLAVFTFTNFTLNAADMITVSGTRPVAILIKSSGTIAGTISANGSTGITGGGT